MVKFLRYALATVCFAASVGCVALWWRSVARVDVLWGPSYVLRSQVIILEAFDGMAYGAMAESSPNAIAVGFGTTWQHYSLAAETMDPRRLDVQRMSKRYGRIHFSVVPATAYFPLWYAALILALAGGASLRLGRRFTIRSAIIATTVAAGLLGMAVGM